MSRFYTFAFVCLLAVLAQAAPMPLTVNEVGLMLRTGYSSKAVLQELSTRRFADTLDATTEAQLVRAGASAELIRAIETGNYTVSAEESARVRQQQEMEAQRRTAAAEESRKLSLRQGQSLQKSVATVPATADSHVIYQQLKGDLVQWRAGAVTHFDDSALENKKYFLIYFSAHWCAPCRKFTPNLVTYYNDVAAKHPELDVIFVSYDRSPFGWETYLREANMPWPVIDFQKVKEKEGILKYAGEAIPDLVLVDGSGKVLADTYRGKEYVGPTKVLEALDGILARGSGNQVAQAR